MISSMQRAARARPNRRHLFAAVIAVSVAGLIAQPAFADGGDRGDHGDRQGDRHDERGNAHHRSERHHYPVYTPEPIYYPRQESPGINVFIPFWDR